jgi:hypothetical protein
MMQRLLLLVAVVALLIGVPTAVLFAQTADSTVWYLSSATVKNATNSTNVVGDSNSIGPAVGWQIASYNANGQRCNLAGPGGNNWPASETDTAAGRYIQFDASAIAGRSFTVKRIFFNYGGAGSTSAVKGKAFYSTDNWSTKTLLNTDSAFIYPNSTVTPYSKAINVAVPKGAKFSLRIYPYWVLSSAGSNSKYSVLDTVVIAGTTALATAVERTQNGVPDRFELQQNYPNPFNPTTAISYQLSATSYVTLKVFDVLGREIATLVDGQLHAGSYQATFDASRLSSGVYLYQLRAGDASTGSAQSFVQTRKMALMK